MTDPPTVPCAAAPANRRVSGRPRQPQVLIPFPGLAPVRAVPRLSIGLPVYNGGRYLADSLDALLGQSYEDFELIISDNASTDDTSEICRHYESQDARIRYCRQARNIGLSPNHNFVVEAAQGELFKWASYDDLYARELLERCVEALDERPDVVLAHSWTAHIDESDAVFAAPVYPLTSDAATSARALSKRSLRERRRRHLRSDTHERAPKGQAAQQLSPRRAHDRGRAQPARSVPPGRRSGSTSAETTLSKPSGHSRPCAPAARTWIDGVRTGCGTRWPVCTRSISGAT